MFSFDALPVIFFLLLVVGRSQMTTLTSKTCWPELIGKTGDEAVQIIKQESDLGLLKVQVCGPGSRTTRDIDDERVRIYVDENNQVTTEPTIG